VALVDEFKEWSARLVEISREHRVLLRCPVRQREFVDGPEERIRQALLHFLLNLTTEVEFVLSAERERHDIDLRWPTSDEFRPTTPPLLIVETKVDVAAGDWTNAQLSRYLQETTGNCGVVFTGRRMWRLDLTPDGPRSVVMASLSELAALVRTRAGLDPLAAARTEFEAACRGDLDALRSLVTQFPYATFVLCIAGRDTWCRHLRFNADAIEYRPADHYVRRSLRAARTDVTRLRRPSR
jgi:hypothetical protein